MTRKYFSGDALTQALSEAARHFEEHRRIQEENARLSRLERAAHNAPGSAQALLRLGYAYHRRGRARLAQRNFVEARRAEPGNATAGGALAVLSLGRRELEEGETLARESVAREATAVGHYALALAHVLRGDRRRAREEVDRAMALLEVSGELFADEIRDLDARLDRD